MAGERDAIRGAGGATPGKPPPDHSEPLARALRDAREQSLASREILHALGSGRGGSEQVLDTIIERAARLCRADAAQLYLLSGDVFRLSRMSGEVPPEFRSYLVEHPVQRSRATLVGRVALDGRAQQIDDVLSDPEYARRDLQQLGGFRSLLSAPMLLGDEVVGVLSVWRNHKALTVEDLFDVAVAHGLHYDAARQRGVVFHMLSCLTECGRVGLTAVADTPEAAQELYRDAEAVLLREAEQALAEHPLPG